MEQASAFDPNAPSAHGAQLAASKGRNRTQARRRCGLCYVDGVEVAGLDEGRYYGVILGIYGD